jgi:hypothetical protein
MSDWAVFFICASAAFATVWICDAAQDMFMRWTRSKNIAAHGWPPKHLDADGDPVSWLDDEEGPQS